MILKLTRWLPQLSRKRPLRFVLALPIVLQALAIVGVVGYLSYRSGQQAVAELAQQQMDETGDRAETQLFQYLSTATSLNRLNAELVRLGALAVDDLPRLERHLFAELNQYPTLSSIMFGDPQGNLRMVSRRRRSTDRWELGASNPQNPNQFDRYAVDPQQRRLGLIASLQPDGVRDRPWYRAAIRDQALGWGELFYLSGDSALTFNTYQPVYASATGQLLGVFAVNLSLQDLSSWLQAINHTPEGMMFIVDGEGLLVATSSHEVPFGVADSLTDRPSESSSESSSERSPTAAHNPVETTSDGAFDVPAQPLPNSQRLSPQDSASPLMATVGRLLAARSPSQALATEEIVAIREGGDRYFVHVRSLQPSGQNLAAPANWQVITVLPEQYFSRQIALYTRKTLFMVLLTLPMAIGVSLFTSYRITRPLWRTIQTAGAIAAGQRPSPTPTASNPIRIQEVDDLTTALHKMVTQIDASYGALQRSEQMFASLFDHLPIGVGVFDTHGNTFLLNRKGTHILQQDRFKRFSTDDLKTFTQLYHLYPRHPKPHLGHHPDPDPGLLDSVDPDQRDHHQPYPIAQLPLFRALQGEASTVDDIEVRHNGQRIPLEVRGMAVANAAGETLYAISTFQDISARCQVEQLRADYAQTLERQVAERTRALQDGDAKFRQLTDNLPLFFGLLQGNQDCWLYGSPGFETLTGYPLADLYTNPTGWQNYLYEGDRPRVLRHLCRHARLNTHTPDTFETRLRHAKGGLRWVRVNLYPVSAPDGSIERICVFAEDITAQKQARDALSQSEAINRAIRNAIPDLLIRMTREGLYLDVKPALTFPMAAPAETMIGRCIYEFLPADVARERMAANARALATGTVQSYEFALPIGSETRWQEARVVPLNANEVLVLIRDISHRKQVEEALRLSEAANQSILSAIPDLMFRVSQEGVYRGYIKTQAVQDIVPLDTDPVGHSLAEHLPADLTQRQLSVIQQVLSTRVVQNYEQQIVINGQMQYEEIAVAPSGDDEVLFMVRDITARKLAEIALQETEATQRAILAAIPDLLIRLTGQGIRLGFMSGGEVTLKEEVVRDRPQSIFETLPLPLAHRRMEAIGQALATGERQVYEQAIVTRGELHYEETRIVKLRDNEVLVMVRDITARKQAEIALQESEAKFRGVFESAAVGICLTALDGHYIQVNASLCEMLGYSEAELLGMTVEEVTHPEDLAKDLDLVQRLLRGEIEFYHLEKRYLSQSGQVVWAMLSLSLICDKDRQPLYFVRLLQNITQQKVMEADLRDANDELEAIAHTDALTQAANRRRFDECMTIEWKRLSRSQNPLSLILLDVDFFKPYNDYYGHQVGDECLRQVTQALQSCTRRPTDLVARYGGEEFAIVLPNTPAEGALTLAQDIRRAIQSLHIAHARSSVSPFVTVSVGLATLVPTPDLSPSWLIRAADAALYEAKQSGRDRFVASS